MTSGSTTLMIEAAREPFAARALNRGIRGSVAGCGTVSDR
jgi:hypothetical protein